VTDIAIKDQLVKLVEIQEIDKEIFDHKKDLVEKPAYLADLKAHYEVKKENMKNLEEKSKSIQVERKAKELDLKSKEDEIAKANTQLSQIKTNKEYTAKITEIENIKADKSIAEEKILESFDDSDKVNVQIDEEKKVLEEEEKKYLSEKKEIEASVKEIEDKIKVLESKKNQLTPGIDKKLLSNYERILHNKEGLAIVPVSGESCGGCFMNVPAQVVNEMKMHEKIVACEMCARILYLEEDV